MGEEKTKSDRIAVRVSREHHEALKALAEEQDKPVSEVLESMIGKALLAGKEVIASNDSILDEATKQDLLAWAEERKMAPTDAAKRLITVAIGRLKALSTYGSKFRKRD